MREKLYPELDNLLSTIKHVVPDQDLDGTLNYIISRIVAGSLKGNEWRYKNIARATAVFECAKLEFYRRIGSQREDVAIKQNGDLKEYV